ncbi:MAG: DUF2961 domain-containing protein [Planctomycetes bacterium]|nr:DUF2961 domain-containing protein [Planctomycetota bacterium]
MWACFRLVAIAGALWGSAPAQDEPSHDLSSLLFAMTDVDWIGWRVPPVGERCVQFSSFDRASRRGAKVAEEWYANQDRGHYLRTETREGRVEHVLVDAEGPGSLVRLWSANPSGTLHFDLDGARVWSVDFAALCRGEVAGVPAPLAAMRSRGGNLYLPVPFARRLVVAATAADLYYLAAVVRYAPGTAVRSFAPAQLEPRGEDLRLLCGALATGLPVPANGARAGAARVEIPAGSLVKELVVTVHERRAGVDLAHVLQGVRLVARAGRETTIDVPLPDFFGSARWTPWRSHLLGILPRNATGRGEAGSGYCRWPMPLPDGGSFEFVAEAAADDVELRLEARFDELQAQAPLRFRASYHLAKAVPTRPFTDHLVLDARGGGRYVGTTLLVRNPSRIWWGEGDEKVWVDGEDFPSWFGTGTEDYFGYAWCDPTPFEAPFHAQIECQGPNNFGFTQLHRTHLHDNIPFQRSLRFELERWHWVPNTTTDYATVAYWYGAPGAVSGLPPVPPAEQRRLERLERPPVWVAEDALEGEALRVVACSAGTHEVQDLGLFERQFSRDAHRWWRGGAPGEALVLAVPVAAAGRYRIAAGFVMADDFGIVQPFLGGGALGAPFDGFAAQVQASGPVVLGEVDLSAGEVELRLQLVGRNERAKPGHMVGLDWLRLERLP